MNSLDILTINADRSDNPLQLNWAGINNPEELLVFYDLTEWTAFIFRLSLSSRVPLNVKSKYERAQNLYLLAWVYFDVIKAGELAALVALELALKDVYMDAYKELKPEYKKPNKPIPPFLKPGLKHMVEKEGLTDEKLPIYQKSGGAVVANLYRDKSNGHTPTEVKTKGKDPIDQTGTLVGIRNSLAHGDPFDAMPWASLLEVVRDLIDYMYPDSPAKL